MATKKQFQDHIIDEIIDAIYSFRDENYFSDPDSAHYIPDLSNLYRKTIGDSGQIETGENLDNEQIVIYQEDYQHSLNSQSMNIYIDVIVICCEFATVQPAALSSVTSPASGSATAPSASIATPVTKS